MAGARFFTALFLIGGIVLASSMPGGAQTPDTSAVTKGDDFRAGVEKETFFLVNQYRKANDMLPLIWDESIAKVARAHSKDMATGEVDFGHDGFRDRVNRLRNIMTGFGGAGENVLMTSQLEGVAKNAVAMWLKSPHHLENIRGDFNYSGMGVCQDKDGTIYFTQIFMKFSPQTEEAQVAKPDPRCYALRDVGGAEYPFAALVGRFLATTQRTQRKAEDRSATKNAEITEGGTDRLGIAGLND